jgi:hypothetical protein
MGAIVAVIMRTFLTLLAVALAAHTAHAQAPGLTMSFEQPVQSPMSAEDRQVLADGEIGQGQWGAGVLGSVVVGFGAGQAIQGRWHDTGWIYTLGESLSLGAVILALPAAFSGDCFDCGHRDTSTSDRAGYIMLGGLIAFAGFHIWEIGDALVGPSMHNQRFAEARARHPETYTVLPYVVPSASGNGGVAGLSLRF